MTNKKHEGDKKSNIVDDKNRATKHKNDSVEDNTKYKILREVHKAQQNSETPQILLKTQDLESQLTNLQDKFLRSLAEIENLRIRSEKNVLEAKNYAISSFAKDLITVMDSLDMALSHKQDDLHVENLHSIVEGVEITRKQLVNIFTKNKIRSIFPQRGEMFDYNMHFAISQDDSVDQESGTIVEVMQVGYKIGDRILRPASVVVAKEKDK